MWYGPASPSKNTSELPTCALTESAARKISTRIPSIRRCMSPLNSMNVPRRNSFARNENRPTERSPSHPPHPIAPCQSQSRGDHTNYQRQYHQRPKPAGSLPSSELVRIIEKIRGIEICKIRHPENPVPRRRRHQEIGKRPLHRQKTQHKNGSGHQRQLSSPPLPCLLPQKVEHHRWHNQQQREPQRYQVRYVLVDGPQLWLRRKQGQDPLKRQQDRRIYHRDYRRAPSPLGTPSRRDQDRRNDNRHRQVACRIVHFRRPGTDRQNRSHLRHATRSNKKQKHSQRAAHTVRRAAHQPSHQRHKPNLDPQ